MKETKEAFSLRVRRFEERLLREMKNIFVPVHLSLGQEWVAAEIWENIQPADFLFSTHRNHHMYFAKGGDEKKLWDEIMGLPGGLNQGFAGSQGISDAEINFHASAIVGGLVGVAAGTAYALKADGAKAIAVCCVGDGGTEAGVFWEAANWSALNALPIAFICENNGMSVDSPIAERQYGALNPKAGAFGLWVARSVKHALELAREGKPSFYEAKVKLECEHIYLGAMLPKEVIA